MTTTVVRASSSSSFLALVPRLLECTPHRSLVLVPFAHGRSLGALRVDLPHGRGQAELDSIASTVIGTACKVARTDAIALAVYADETLNGGAPLPHRDFVDAVLARADICGLRVVDALVVGANAWNSYLDPSIPAGRPLAEIGSALTDAPDTLVAPDQFSAAELPDPDPALARAVARLLDDVDRVLARPRDRARLSAARQGAADDIVTALADPPALLEPAPTRSPLRGWPRSGSASSAPHCATSPSCSGRGTSRSATPCSTRRRPSATVNPSRSTWRGRCGARAPLPTPTGSATRWSSADGWRRWFRASGVPVRYRPAPGWPGPPVARRTRAPTRRPPSRSTVRTASARSC